MSDEQKEQSRLELDIYGHTFRLRAPAEDHDRLKRAARRVDEVLREISVSQVTPDTTRLGIQAAFLISLDYVKLVDDIDNRNGATDENRKKVDDLLQRLEESLREL